MAQINAALASEVSDGIPTLELGFPRAETNNV